jgi:signal transduction histidine kinase
MRDRQKGAVQYAYPLKEVYRAVSGINLTLLLLAPFALAGAGLVGVTLTNRVLRRVQVMTQAAGRIGAADFSRRLPVTGDDEFSELAETFNGLLGGLDSAYQQQQELMKLQQRFTADASHELKTPLTIIKGRAGLGLERAGVDDKSRRAFEEIESAANTMDKLVQDLLLLARSDEGRLGNQQTELLVQEVLSTARAQTAGAERVLLEIDNEEVTVSGNEIELVRVFRNLIDNALSYSPSDKPVLVSARRELDMAIVTVTDHGSGISPEHLPHLGERFYRVDASRTRPTGGTGLGLSICGSIVSAHGGAMEFKSDVGVGTTVTVRLPV